MASFHRRFGSPLELRLEDRRVELRVDEGRLRAGGPSRRRSPPGPSGVGGLAATGSFGRAGRVASAAAGADDDRPAARVARRRRHAVVRLQLDRRGRVIAGGAADDQRPRRRVVAERVQLPAAADRDVLVHRPGCGTGGGWALEPLAAGDGLDDQVHEQAGSGRRPGGRTGRRGYRTGRGCRRRPGEAAAADALVALIRPAGRTVAGTALIWPPPGRRPPAPPNWPPNCCCRTRRRTPGSSAAAERPGRRSPAAGSGLDRFWNSVCWFTESGIGITRSATGKTRVTFSSSRRSKVVISM